MSAEDHTNNEQQHHQDELETDSHDEMGALLDRPGTDVFATEDNPNPKSDGGVNVNSQIERPALKQADQDAKLEEDSDVTITQVKLRSPPSAFSELTDQPYTNAPKPTRAKRSIRELQSVVQSQPSDFDGASDTLGINDSFVYIYARPLPATVLRKVLDYCRIIDIEKSNTIFKLHDAQGRVLRIEFVVKPEANPFEVEVPVGKKYDTVLTIFSQYNTEAANLCHFARKFIEMLSPGSSLISVHITELLTNGINAHRTIIDSCKGMGWAALLIPLNCTLHLKFRAPPMTNAKKRQRTQRGGPQPRNYPLTLHCGQQAILDPTFVSSYDWGITGVDCLRDKAVFGVVFFKPARGTVDDDMLELLNFDDGFNAKAGF